MDKETGPANSTTRYVLLHLSTLMTPDGGKCYRGTRRLAEDTALDRRTLQRHIKIADEEGWVESVERTGGSGGRFNQYFPAFPKGVASQGRHDEEGENGQSAALSSNTDRGPGVTVTPGQEDDDQRGGTESQRGGTESQRGGTESPTWRHGAAQLGITGSYIDNTGRLAGFFEFWKNYPPRTGDSGEAEAKAAFESAVREGATPEAIIDGARRYREYAAANNTESRYITRADNWLLKSKWQEPWHIAGGPAHGNRPRRVPAPKSAPHDNPALSIDTDTPAEWEPSPELANPLGDIFTLCERDDLRWLQTVLCLQRSVTPSDLIAAGTVLRRRLAYRIHCRQNQDGRVAS